MRNPFKHTTLALLAAALLVPAATSAAQSQFTDDFSGYSTTEELLEAYGVGKFAGKKAKAAGDAVLDDAADTLVLTASALDGDKEAGSFTLTTLTRKGDFVMLGPEPKVEFSATFDEIDGVAFGAKPVSLVTVGLAAPRGGPSITGQVGIQKVRASKLDNRYAAIEIKAEDGRQTIAEVTMEEAPAVAGKPITLSVQGGQVDLLIDGETVIDGPIDLPVDLSTSTLGTTALVPTVQVRKSFGKQARSAVLSSIALDDQTDQAAVQALLPDVRIELSEPPAEGTALAATAGMRREVPEYFLGLNGNLTKLNKPWDNQQLVATVKSLKPRTIRYPAGSIGNVWDWDRGWVMTTDEIDYDKSIKWVRGMAKSKKRYTVEHLAQGAQTADFEPVFVLNMVHHTLDEQIGHLERYEAAGGTVKYIELGNEYYFGRGADAYIVDHFPEPVDYANEANEWAAALSKRFPDALLAACGSSGGEAKHSDRRRAWNDIVAPLLSDDVDAFTVHTYPGHGVDGLLEGNNMEDQGKAKYNKRLAPAEIQQQLIAKLKTDKGLAVMLTRPDDDWRMINGRTEFPDLPLWITEWNMDDKAGGVRHTWAHGLFVAAHMNTWLTDPRVEMLHFHNIHGGDAYPAMWDKKGVPDKFETAGKRPVTEPFSLTAGGFVMKLFADAMGETRSATKLEIEDAPSIFMDLDDGKGGHTTNLAFGWVFDSGTLLVNSTSSPVTLKADPLAGRTSKATAYQAAPEDLIAGVDSVQTSDIAIAADGTLTLPPHSITVGNWTRTASR